jgi:hypothetical protein
MSNYGTYAVCPYYTTETNNTIICEGVIETGNVRSSNHLIFAVTKGTKKKKSDKGRWIKRYCESNNYLDCPYAAFLQKQYDDKEKKANENTNAKISISNKNSQTAGKGN